jgi:signal transduction histidine kinase
MFLAILSHDLRNPLNAITLSAKVARRDSAGNHSNDPLLSSIVSSADAMAQLVDDLLDFAQSGLGGAIPVRPARFEIDALCSQVVDELRRGHPGRIIRYSGPENLSVTWDPGRIRQVISNLLGNAIQHGSADSPVDLELSVVDGSVQIKVCNQGPPIPPGQLHWIFDPLKRGATAESDVVPASGRSVGLGLYIARAIVMAHNGTISVISTAAEGTCFTVRVPFSPSPAAGA